MPGKDSAYQHEILAFTGNAATFPVFYLCLADGNITWLLSLINGLCLFTALVFLIKYGNVVLEFIFTSGDQADGFQCLFRRFILK